MSKSMQILSWHSPFLNAHFFSRSSHLVRLNTQFTHSYFGRSRFPKHTPTRKALRACSNSPHFGSPLHESAHIDQKEIDAKNELLPFKVIPRQLTSNQNQCRPRRGSLAKQYLKLTKPNLTVLVTLSSICSYAISPNTATISELLFLTLGTALCSGSANAINMAREPELDRKMSRTANRPVVTGFIKPNQAYLFASITGSLGVSILYWGVNPTVAALGALNIGLYSWIYTSLKRKSILNTWVGAIVGAIPPMMGWAATSSLSHPGAWCLAALLYAWQFPHFNALSHNIAQEYKSAGYVMTAAENPRLNARVSLRYALLMFPICFGLSYFGVTDWGFQFDSAIANGWLSWLAFKFWAQQRLNYGKEPALPEGVRLASTYARQLFWCSVWHLPAVLILAMLHKRGQWDRVRAFFGADVELPLQCT